MKLTVTHNGKLIELELTEEQVEVLKKEEKKTGWGIVEVEQEYWRCESTRIHSRKEKDSGANCEDYACANYFSYHELARNIARAQTLQRKLWRMSAELCEKVDWSNLDRRKCFIWYDYEKKNMYIGTTKECCDFGQVYFDTKEHAKQAVEEFYNELTWYFTEFRSRMD